MTKPPLTPLKSSALAGMHYDQATRRLTVETHGADGKPGRRYEYDDVLPERAHTLATTASAGRYWNQQVKPFHVGREVK